MKSLPYLTRFTLAIIVLLVALLVAIPSSGQVQNGQISGDITDPSGAAVPNASVTIKDPQTGYTAATTANATGHFVVNQVPVGTYVVTVSGKGFKTLTRSGVVVHPGTIAHLDSKLQVGQVNEVVEVTGAQPAVETETSQMAQVVSSNQVANLPLNGRNVYDLIQLSPGAVNVTGVDFENGHSTVVNGLRENFNGFLINGISNKGLSGGVNNVPIQDSVQEFQQLTLNNSAQYGNSAGSITNLVTKSGTNDWHGTVWDFLRNDKLDANEFFLNQQGVPKQKLRFNQVGGTFGGPIVKDKLFIFLAYQHDHFTSIAPPNPVLVESPQFRQAVINALPNSTAALLYKSFPWNPPVSNCTPLTDSNGNPVSITNFETGLGNTITPRIASAFSALQAAFPVGTPFQCNSVSVVPQQTQTFGNLFQGNEASGRLDYQRSDKDHFFAQYNWLRSSDTNGPCIPNCTRGFVNPTRNIYPNGQITWDHTFSSKVVNEARAGYTSNNTKIGTAVPGVPLVAFDDGSVGFGSYNGYPQTFKEHVYNYGDMVSINKGSHNIKIGADFKRNLENSEFDVSRPSYDFFDALYFAADAPYEEDAGVNPGFISGQAAHLETNIRHFRNLEFGAYVQDDWKVNRRLTLNLGLRYDLFTRHTELNNLVTNFIPGPGNTYVDNITTGAGQIKDANAPCTDPRATVAGVCGPGGFAKASSLGKGDHNNFGPRVGFALDVFGDAKTALRGGFGVSYESTLYNPLSNSRWNPPFYSFNTAVDTVLGGGNSVVVYGPTTCDPSGTVCVPSGAAPTFVGPPTNPGQGFGANNVGNLSGWAAANPQTAFLTGVIFPKGIRDPYVYNFYLSMQHEIAPKLSVEVDYVGTAGHKLFRADDVNRIPGAKLPLGACVKDYLGRTVCGQPGGILNPNYINLRAWENAANSNYNALQFAVKKQTSHGIMFNVNYTWSHSIDNGSTWHSGATTANGDAAGDGFTTDSTNPALDRGNSIFDIRQRLVLNYVWDLPFGQHTGFANALLGGWQLNGIWSFQSGAHWSPYTRARENLVEISDPTVDCTAADVTSGNCQNIGGSFLLNRTNSHSRNSRPDSTIPSFDGATHDMWANGWGSQWELGNGIFSAPTCLVCAGTLGRNTFVGPGQWYADMSLFKNFKVTERVNFQFRAEVFNIFNHTNFVLATNNQASIESTHNRIDVPSNFGQAGGTLNPRNLQLGVKLQF